MQADVELHQESALAGRITALSIRDLSISFGGITALDGMTFDVEKGTVCGLIGPNGAGKTTLFNCLSRIYEPASGQIRCGDVDVLKVPQHDVVRLGISRTFQNIALFKTMSVLDNILVGAHCTASSGFVANALRTFGVKREEGCLRERAGDLLRLLNLVAVQDKAVADLPFGYQKRVELARALASNPMLILLDEPACGLNHEEIDGLRTIIRRIRDELGITVLLVEHHMGLVMSVSDKVVALNFGQKIAEGSPSEVQGHPDVIRAYLGGKS
ncbi:ABC transporter ATP-binding protein [Bradyrhizobium sp. AUGA SZCCT0431]|uniref:ABC transporter ATP-binding protein n=1 Tax=Bradyrhizobium sp. AUGA SZCCT0431 TaxID=2807674 RepID=UPI001BA8994D|nr:ABC transporter ATP-binding protein [Bradyrhizobium sp. AUGA SZCCT0431]MBR1146179.1 ABC transporter ATP-binding protein [Bradyrhizobium sp. AUGA SZCCT0431]